jgi:hypothetical protein
MSLQEAMEFVPDDLPDGAFWAMAHEIAGAEYGDCWDELKQPKAYIPSTKKEDRVIECTQCHRKFATRETLRQHEAAMVRNGTHTRIEAIDCPQPNVTLPTKEST